ncbi:Ctr copper transporter [Phlegmacium glaucopus]|nr:Ctr copper transporter [Phlegmacium glaucopus]
MDHGGHGEHFMPIKPFCKMNMLWNTDIINTCIVFRTWHVSSNAFFLGSCIFIVLLGIFYEYLRVFQRKLDYRIALSLQNKGKRRSTASSGRNSPEGVSEDSALLTGRILNPSLAGTPVPAILRAIRALTYGATVFLSFFLMLIFMTYNAYLIAAVVVGACLGHYIFGSTININAILADPSAGKGMACH